jgi:catechol 2,3-dioxygenase-like lactoylglutathione lyase family enzyme
MWGNPPFWISDNVAVDVRSLAVALDWYKEKLGLRDAKTSREDDSGRPFADLRVSGEDTFLSLIELAPGASANRGHVIFFASNLEKTRQWLEGRGIAVEPITVDSGGNHYFRFRDLDGNAIEVCVEP